jgi:ribosomal protein S18 acetylase RimI-like enzyme
MQSLTAVSAAAQANYAGIYKLLGQLPDVEILDTEQISRITTPVPHAMTNGVFRTNFSDDEADEAIASTLRHFAERSLPLSWAVFSDSRPADLATRLEAHGMMVAVTMPIMAVEIDAMPPASLPGPSVDIRPVADDESAAAWSRIVAAGFGLTPGVEELFQALQRLHSRDENAPYRSFVAYLNGQSVGASTAFTSHGVIGLYCVGVNPEARRQGIGQAVTMAAVQEGKRRGCRVAVLEASALGESVYRRLGFQTIDHVAVLVPGVPH